MLQYNSFTHPSLDPIKVAQVYKVVMQQQSMHNYFIIVKFS